MRRILFVVMLLVLALPSLPVARAAESGADSQAVTCPRVEHKITLLRPGSKSEAEQGWLSVDCVLLPDSFQRVVVDGQEFTFVQRPYLWGADGYHPTGRTVEFPLAPKVANEQDLAQGWYLGSDKLTGTPDDWIYVEWTSGAAWVLPAAVMDLVSAESIPDLERETTFSGLTREPAPASVDGPGSTEGPAPETGSQDAQ